MEEAAASSRRMACEAGLFVQLAAELNKREGWRAEGATSLEAWIVERCGVSLANARAFAHVAEKLDDLPHLAAGLSSGELSFDKVRAVADLATPESDPDLAALAQDSTVRQLHEVARTERGVSRSRAQTDYEARSVRFNDSCRTVTAQLPPESYAEVKAVLEARARALPSDGETHWDQRLCDGFLELARSGHDPSSTVHPHVVVAHVPLEALTDESSELAGELEHNGSDQRRDRAPDRLRRHRDRGSRRRRRTHDVRRPGPTMAVRDPAPRDHPTGPALSLPGMHQCRPSPTCTTSSSGNRAGARTWTIWSRSASTITIGCTARVGL